MVSVRFKNRGKVYFFSPGGFEVKSGQQVIVETSKGLEIGECSGGNHNVADERIIPPLRPVIRLATENDARCALINKTREAEAFEVCRKKIAEHGLDMKLVEVECNFEGSKIMFFFTSDGRVDFRELVKDLASVCKTRIELRQIGVRDETKMLGGIGICGRAYCCKQFLDDFQPVSTKMAKIQSISLNPTKISGSCGRLMCCLRYEHEAYEDLVTKVPRAGTPVRTPAGYGSVTQVNLLRRKIKVKLDTDGDEVVIKQYDADEVAVLTAGKSKSGEEPCEAEFEPDREEMLPDYLDDTNMSFPAEISETPEFRADAQVTETPARKKSSRRKKGKKGGGERNNNPVLGLKRTPNPKSQAAPPAIGTEERAPAEEKRLKKFPGSGGRKNTKSKSKSESAGSAGS